MIIHFILNSLFVFAVLALSIECFLLIFRITNSRVRYCCRSLPILKLPFDILIFGFYGDSLFINLNPFSCELYMQEMIMSILPINPEYEAISTVIIPEYIANQIPFSWYIGLTTLFVCVSTFMMGRKIFNLFRSRHYLKSILAKALPSTRLIGNAKLRNKIIEADYKILVSADLQIPCATTQKYILIPANLVDTLSQDEFDSVIAHEMEHLRWKDPLLKLFYSVIGTFFWWIPMNWLLRKIESDQEKGSDYGLIHYGIDSIALASALMKVLTHTKQLRYDSMAICQLRSSKHVSIDRLSLILDSYQMTHNYYANAMGLPICLIIFNSFWAC